PPAPAPPPPALHDALPIYAGGARREGPVGEHDGVAAGGQGVPQPRAVRRHELHGTPRVRGRERAVSQELRADERRTPGAEAEPIDRKSTRLNSSHLGISYA